MMRGTHHAPDTVPAFAEELALLGRQVRSSLGARDLRYIKGVQKLVFVLEALGRGLMMASFFWPFWAFGVMLLSASKIIENTELGHNIMHGQYDWTRDPGLAGRHYEFDAVATSDGWRSCHNHNHHLNTGIVGLDNDIGMLRFAAWQPWSWRHLLQVPLALMSALFAQWGVALQVMRPGDVISGHVSRSVFLRDRVRPFLRKTSGRLLKDYALFPMLAGPFFFDVLVGNLLANGIRNVWIWLVIACGHCVKGIKVFSESEVKALPVEHWWVRQVESSANFMSGRFLSILTGHLGYHVEHHLFPDIPSCRYPEMAPTVRQICIRHNVEYNTASFSRRLIELFFRVLVFSLPVSVKSSRARSKSVSFRAES